MHLQKLHASHRDKGLVVIGFNCWDDHDIARELLAKNSITFPTVLDASAPAMMTAMQKYKMNGVPLTYVIDREGKVAEAFYGYTEGDTRGFETVKKLGVELE